MSAQIKTIDKLPRVFLLYLADRLGYKAWIKKDEKLQLEDAGDDTTDWELADFISRSI